MELFKYMIFAVIFVSAFFIFYLGDVHVEKIFTGEADINIIIFLCLFFLIIMLAVGFLFATTPRYGMPRGNYYVRIF